MMLGVANIPLKFPAPMGPQPLVGILADILLQKAGVSHGHSQHGGFFVAGSRRVNWLTGDHHVPIISLPSQKQREHGTAAADSELSRSPGEGGWPTKKIYYDGG